MTTAPIAVLPVALAGALALWAGEALEVPAPVGAALVVAVLAAATGGLHLDGLADTVDGLAVPGPREVRLEVMRRSDVGPTGVATLVLALLLQVGAISGLVAGSGTQEVVAAVALAVLVSRTTLALACVRGLPAARPDGLGSAVAGTVPPLALLLVGGLALAGAAWANGWHGLAGVLAAFGATGAGLWWCRRRLGGITGDVLGASVELAFTACLLAQVSR
jgi:adenosylcobinamide-GDP ribazoletransferase